MVRKKCCDLTEWLVVRKLAAAQKDVETGLHAETHTFGVHSWWHKPTPMLEVTFCLGKLLRFVCISFLICKTNSYVWFFSKALLRFGDGKCVLVVVLLINGNAEAMHQFCWWPPVGCSHLPFSLKQRLNLKRQLICIQCKHIHSLIKIHCCFVNTYKIKTDTLPNPVDVIWLRCESA